MSHISQHGRDALTGLLLRAASGDQKAFERLHTALGPMVSDYLGKLDGGIDDQRRQELVQEVMFRTWRGLGRFRGEALAKTYVFAIAKRVLREERRKRVRAHTTGISDFERFSGTYMSIPPETPARLQQIELADRIRQTVGQLPGVQREAFDLVHLQDRPIAEAAKVANCSVKQLQDRLRRARKRLRWLLRDLPRSPLP